LETVLRDRDTRQRHHPLYQLLDFFVRLTGRMPGFSYWFALVLITVLIKAILYPLTKRQFKYMADMQRIAPKMKEVQEKLKGRPADEINRKVMALYKEEGVNPAAGCLPMFAQMAVLIPLYNMVRVYEYQFRQGYFLWIGSALSHQYPQFLATSLAVADVPLLLLYACSLVLTSRLQPVATDPQQAQTQKMMTYGMPIIFSFMSWKMAWPSAFTFYWLIMNVVSTWQQWRILKGANVATSPASSSGGSRPVTPPLAGPPPGGNGRNGQSDVKPGGVKRSGSKKQGRR
jgi:YidC/Oxa1 family membrane protein insertase